MIEIAESEPQPTQELAITAIASVDRKCFVAETKTLKNGDVEGYITTESVDRMGDIIRAKGWELGNYKKTGSPVIYGHSDKITPLGIPHIGNAVQMEVQRKGIWSVTRFHEKTQVSREAAILAREKIVPNWSVGFNPLETPEQRLVNGELKGFIFNRQELLEYSMVLIPANAEAVSKAMFYVGKGLIRREVAAVIAGPAPLAEEDRGKEDVRPTAEAAPRAARSSDEHLAKMAGMFFLKRLDK